MNHKKVTTILANNKHDVMCTTSSTCKSLYMHEMVPGDVAVQDV